MIFKISRLTTSFFLHSHKLYTLKILVVDNEEAIRLSLIRQLNHLGFNRTNVFEATGVADGIEAINKVHPDLVFLDVELDDGTGFDLIQRLSSYDFQLVFITAHNKYAIQAFRMSAIDFLLKPIDDDELATAITKVKEHLSKQHLATQIEVLQNALSNLHIADQKMVLQDSKSIYFVKVSDICCCLAEGSYTTFYFIGQEKIVVSKLLKEYEQLLEPMGFIRTHHSWLVNKNRISRFDKADGGSLFLENGQIVPVSQRKKEVVLDMLSKRS